MKPRTAILILTPCLIIACIIAANMLSSGEGDDPMVVYKSPTCGCCVKWIEHVEARGFEVISHDSNAMRSIKETNGVPQRGYSCHTAIVDGYVIEGHVPAEYIVQLLEEKPEVAGLTVPGMPIGSPGMEGPNPESYIVYAFDSRGAMTEYATVSP